MGSSNRARPVKGHVSKSMTFVPRRDQVAELTRGLKLPFSPLHQTHIEAITDVIGRAWNDLSLSQPNVLKYGSEAEINALMGVRLNALLDDDPLWRLLVRSVTRGSEAISYDGSHLEKRPDLSIHLTARNPSFPLIVECKLIDEKSQKTSKLYCDQGLTRYIVGEYAWGTPEALMVAYVRDGSTIESSLTPFLIESEKLTPPPYLLMSGPETSPHATLDLARSHHQRAFKYLASPPDDVPGPIALWHLWASTPS
jgi:hypothetical protein